MSPNPQAKSNTQNYQNSKMAFNNLEDWLKQFELMYNLSPELSKSQIEKLQEEFRKILNSQ